MNSIIGQILTIASFFGRRAIGRRANHLLCLCILVSTCVASSLSFFSKSVQTALDKDIANYLGAPLVIRSDQATLLDFPKIEGFDQPVTTSAFTTGAISENQYQSISLKAVSNNYPLQGELLVRTGNSEHSLKGLDLKSDQVWLDQRAMAELNVNLGDSVQIGKQTFNVVGEVLFEPDRLTQLQHALPRAMVSDQGLRNTGVQIDNDRGEFRLLFSGDKLSLDRLEVRLKELIKHDYEVLKPSAGKHPFSRLSIRAERMLNVVLVLILILCGGAAAALADHSVKQYSMPATVLRCMGANRRSVAWGLCLQLLVLVFAMSLIGCFLGWLSQYFLVNVMQPHMTLEIVRLTVMDFLKPTLIGLLTLIVFIVPKLHQLGSVSVNSVLRGYIEPSKSSFIVSVSLAVFVIIGILWSSSDNYQLTTMLFAAVVFLLVISIFLGWVLSKSAAQTHHLFKGTLKVAIRSIGRSSFRHIVPLVTISLAMMAMLMTATLRGSFLEVLESQMLEVDGNFLYSGLPEAEETSFLSSIKQANAEVRAMHPTVSAKLFKINGLPIEQALNKESDTREETRSKVRLSWSEEVPANNKLLKGSWPLVGTNQVSVEYEVMSDLGLKIGDQLEFLIGDKTLTSTITSQREYRGGGSRMMFWFMFAPDALDDFEQKLMGGIMIENNQNDVLRRLNNQFPQIRITNLERQISGIRDIMTVLTRLMNTILLLLLAGALMVIMASSFVSAESRQSQLTLLRAFGLRRAQCYAMNMVEQLTVSFLACFVGLLGVQLIAGLMFSNLFNLSYQLDWWRALSLTMLISGTFTFLGWLFAYKNLKTPVRLST